MEASNERETLRQLLACIRDDRSTDFKDILRNVTNKQDRKNLVDSPITDKSTLLMGAACRNRAEIVKYLINDCDCDVNQKNIADWTALMFASFEGNVQIVQELLEKNPDINAVNSLGSTALHLATEKGHFAVVKELLKRNPKLDIKDNAGGTCYRVAKYKNHPEIMNLLKQKDKFIDFEDAIKQTIRDDDCVEFEKLTLEKNEKPDTRLDDNCTWLMCASFQGSEKIVKYLLKKQCDVNLKGTAGWTALMLAAYAGHETIVKLLLDNGAEKNASNDLGSTALHLSTLNNHLEIVKMLLEHGIDRDIKDKASLTANDIAIRKTFGNISKLLRIKPKIPLFINTKSFNAIGKLIDYAYCNKASSLKIDKTNINTMACLLFEYDGIEMSQDSMHEFFRNQSLMDLGKNVLIFCVSEKVLVGYMTQAGDGKEPYLIEYRLPDLTRGDNFDQSKLKSIVTDSLFKTEDDLHKELTEFSMQPSRKLTRIIIFNLEIQNHDMKDPSDIKWPKEKDKKLVSLREFCRILYLKHNVKIKLMGVEVDSILSGNFLDKQEKKKYKDKNKHSVEMTFGFPKNIEQIQVYGLLLYSNNRLMDIQERFSEGKAIGVVDIDDSTIRVESLRQSFNENLKQYLKKHKIKPKQESKICTEKQSSSSDSANYSGKRYVDNDYNRRHNRAGKPLFSVPIPAKTQVYKFPLFNRSLSRVGQSLGTSSNKNWSYADVLQKLMSTQEGEDFPENITELYENDKAAKYFINHYMDLMMREKTIRGWLEEKGKGWKAQSHLSLQTIEKQKGNVILFKELELIAKIGHGELGEVHFAKWKDGEVVAVKTMTAEPMFQRKCQQFKEKIKVACTLQHLNIVTFLGVCDTGYHIVMEYMDISLFDALHIKQVDFAEQDKLKIMSDIAKGIEYLHASNIAHCDLKTSNVLLNNVPEQEITDSQERVIAKITDFSFSVMKNDIESSASAVDNIKTPIYQAPEVLRDKTLDVDKLMKDDVYSEGMVIWELVVEEIPYEDMTMQQLELQFKEMSVKPSNSSGLKLSRQLQKMLEKCCSCKPEDRPSARSVCLMVDNIHKLFVDGEGK